MRDTIGLALSDSGGVTTKEPHGPPGFTLIEILVALMVLSVLIGAIYPIVIPIIKQSEGGGAAHELSSIRTAVSVFVANTIVCPGDLEDLIYRIGGADRDLDAVSYSTSATLRWNGPYATLATSESGEAAGTVKTMANGGAIQADIVRFDSESNSKAVTGTFAALLITGLSGAAFDELNDQVDGHLESPSRNQGRLRFKQPPTIAPDLTEGETYYLVYPCVS